MKKYRKKPLVIEAVEIDQSILYNPTFMSHIKLRPPVSLDSVRTSWDLGNCEGPPHVGYVHTYDVKTKYGFAFCYDGDYLIVGIEGEIYPCKRSVFLDSYQEVTPTQPNPFIEEGDPE